MIRVCPICNTKESSLYMRKNARNNRDKVELRKCKNCGFVYSIVSRFRYEGFGNNIDVIFKTREELLEIAYNQNVNKLVSEIIKKSGLKDGSKVLDFGCGIGLISLCFQEHGFQTFGIEKSNPFLQKHKDLNIKSASKLEEFKYEKGNFDIIILKDVLEHVDFPVETLKLLVSYLKPNGYFYIRIPNVYYYPFHWSIDTEAHINHFTTKILDKLFLENKMKKNSFINVYDIKTKVGKIYHAVFWNLRYILPMYHQISVLYKQALKMGFLWGKIGGSPDQCLMADGNGSQKIT